MAGFVRAPADVLALRERLAVDVERCLADTGIPVAREGATEGHAGIVVDVDPGDDAAGGVFVGWKTHADLCAAMGADLLAHEFESPAMRRFQLVTTTCMRAVRELLLSSGFTVADAGVTDDYRSGMVAVLSGPRRAVT